MKRIIAVFLLFVLCFASSCAPTSDLPAETTVSPEPPAEIPIIRDGKTDFTVVRSEYASQKIIDLAVELDQLFKTRYSVAVPIKSDFYRGLKKVETPAIYVGVTEEARCAELASDLHADDFVVTSDGKNIYLIGGSDDATVNAVDYFIAHYIRTSPDDCLIWQGEGTLYRCAYAFTDVRLGEHPLSDFSIVYPHTADDYAEMALRLREQLKYLTGIELTCQSDVTPAAECEILLGPTIRESSQKAVASLSGTPNLWSVSAGKEALVVISASGLRTTGAAIDGWINELKSIAGNQTGLSLDLSDFALTGDVTEAARAERDPAADLRIMDANVLLTNDPSIATARRAEYFADIVRTYRPDVICFNEFYYDIATEITRRLEDRYDFITPDFEDVFNNDYTGYTNDVTKLYSHECAEIVAVRRDAGLKVLASGFRYTTEKWWVHGISWVLFEMKDGRKFAALGNHYGDQSVGNFGTETVQVVRELREKYGDLPIVVTGDLYAWEGDLPYVTILQAGFFDSYTDQSTRVSRGRGSAHALGSVLTGTDSPIDHILCSTGIRCLKHHLIADLYSKWSSDHFPIYADLALPQ